MSAAYTISVATRDRVAKKFGEVIKRAQERFGLGAEELGRMRLEIANDLPRDWAGSAHRRTHLLRLSLSHLLQHEDYVVDEVLPHEVAHVVQQIVYPNATQAHGPEWKFVMRELGCKFSTYHSLPTVATRRKVDVNEFI